MDWPAFRRRRTTQSPLLTGPGIRWCPRGHSAIAGQEFGDPGGDRLGMFEHEEVTAASDDVQLGVRDEPGQDATVDERHDRVVVTCEDKRRLTQLPEPGGAGCERRGRCGDWKSDTSDQSLPGPATNMPRTDLAAAS